MGWASPPSNAHTKQRATILTAPFCLGDMGLRLRLFLLWWLGSSPFMLGPLSQPPEKEGSLPGEKGSFWNPPDPLLSLP